MTYGRGSRKYLRYGEVCILGPEPRPVTPLILSLGRHRVSSGRGKKWFLKKTFELCFFSLSKFTHKMRGFYLRDLSILNLMSLPLSSVLFRHWVVTYKREVRHVYVCPLQCS